MPKRPEGKHKWGGGKSLLFQSKSLLPNTNQQSVHVSVLHFLSTETAFLSCFDDFPGRGHVGPMHGKSEMAGSCFLPRLLAERSKNSCLWCQQGRLLADHETFLHFERQDQLKCSFLPTELR